MPLRRTDGESGEVSDGRSRANWANLRRLERSRWVARHRKASNRNGMGYYELEDVLADGCEVPCKFQYSMPGLGYLEGNAGKPIEKNAKLALPLWLARVLAIVGGEGDEDGFADDEDALPFVELSRPDMFSAKVVNAIKAGPASLDLHSVNAHFYMLAIKWIALFGDAELGAVVTELVLERALELNGHAGSVSVSAVEAQASQLGSPFLLTLDESEKETYRRAHDSYKRTKRWLIER